MKWHDKGDRLIVETASTIKCNLLEVGFSWTCESHYQ